MDTKNKVLEYLESNKGTSVSGGKIADKLGVTRSAVWKAIKSLQDEGYSITAVTNKGYCLSEKNDIISAESIKPYLNKKTKNMDVQVFKIIDSTSNYAKKLAQEGAPEGTVIISEEQTQGRGRMGREFYSPSSTGIYMSIILRPKMSVEDSLLITTSVAVAVAKAIEKIAYIDTQIKWVKYISFTHLICVSIYAKAIEKIAYIDTQIKWVNDIYFNGKKLCGILTEASLDFESGGLEYAVVGIGINVSTVQDSFPTSIRKIVTSIFPNKSPRPVRSILIGEILNNIAECSDNITDKSYLDEYKKRSFLIGKSIVVINNETRTNARAIEIDDKARLIVRFEDGKTQALNSGEVSVRVK